MNLIRFAGDFIHLLATSNLLFDIFKSGSCDGVSGKSQILLTLVWITRYADMLGSFVSVYNSVMKALYILTAVVMLILIYVRFRGTNDRKVDSFRIEFLIFPCWMLALVVNEQFSLLEVSWAFSTYLEAVAILPQFYILARRGSMPRMIRDYLLLLALYRTLYIGNWIWRFYVDGEFHPIAVVSGCVQAMLVWSFLATFLADERPEETRETVEWREGKLSGGTFYVRDLSEHLATVIYSCDECVFFALNDLQAEITRRGVVTRNSELKLHGFRSFKMFVEDQPWLVLFNKGDDWFVRRRLSRESRPPRPMIDANRRPCKETKNPQEETEKEKKTPTDGDEGFVDPYDV